ncbi:RCC1 domain-containing protein [Psychrobacter sp. AOP22-C1-C5]|uniref:RCC1 domain-containing protein n=1 Tax=Psychrobacter sp. AOP22-C1-C5 TaxID=3457716 RepID=UPI0040363018
MAAAGYKHNLILTSDGSVWAFGANDQGQLGNGTNSTSSLPVSVDFSAANDIGHIVQVVASANSSYALDDKGQVWGWGSDAYANLGKGSACTTATHCTNINATPVRIHVINDQVKSSTAQNAEKVTQLAAGRDHVLALTSAETVYGWGLNDTSQVGYNGETLHNTENAWANIIVMPTKIPWFTNKDIRRVYANGHASYALLDNMLIDSESMSPESTDTESKANGILYPWGAFGETNSAGNTIYRNLDEPNNKVLSLKNIDNMAVGIMHLIAHEKPRHQNNMSDLKNDSLLTWGWSFEGSLGNKDTTQIWMYNTPSPVNLPSQL